MKRGFVTIPGREAQAPYPVPANKKPMGVNFNSKVFATREDATNAAKTFVHQCNLEEVYVAEILMKVQRVPTVVEVVELTYDPTPAFNGPPEPTESTDEF